MAPIEPITFCFMQNCLRKRKNTFILPSDPMLAKKWLIQMGIISDKFDTVQQIDVCDEHFQFIVNHVKTIQKQSNETMIETTSTPPTQTYSDIVEDIILKSLSKASESCIINTLSDSRHETNITTSLESQKRACDETLDNQTKRRNYGDNQSSYPDNTNEQLNTSLIVELLKKIKTISQVPEVIKDFTLKMYAIYPQAYTILHNFLQLPSITALKNVFNGRIILSDDTPFARMLQDKVTVMSETQKHCVICLGEMQLKDNLYYDIRYDRLLGIYDIHGIQKPKTANVALILTVQGLFTDWKQPIANAFCRSKDMNDSELIKEWIDKNITHLFKIGLKVRAYVTDTNYMSDIPEYQLTQQGHKIYCIHDVPSSYKMFYKDLSTHDFSYGRVGTVAKMQHILNYYEIDCKKALRLTPKVTDKHVKSVQSLDIKQVEEVISLEVATAMSAYIDAGVLDSSAKSTVSLLKDLSILYQVLRSDSCDTSIKVSATAKNYIDCIHHMLLFFNGLKILNSGTNEEKPKNGTFVDKIQKTLKSMLLLYEDIKKNNDFEVLPAKRLSLDYMRSLYDEVKKVLKATVQPTCKDVNSMFLKSALTNIFKPVNSIKCIELETAINQTNELMESFTTNERQTENKYLDMKISRSEYKSIDLIKRKNCVVLLAGFILKKCLDRHADCIYMKNYAGIVSHDTNSICNVILPEIHKGVCVVPQEEFIGFVEILEMRFRSYMTKDILATVNGELMKGFLVSIGRASFPMPCKCFPIIYAKKLYFRVRTYNLLLFNNTNWRYGRLRNTNSKLVVNV